MGKPRHLKTQAFIHKKLFENIPGFNELESRISALPTKQERGEAFEVFAEAYLATQAIAQAKQVFPFDAIPLPIRTKLALDTERDMGVDGVLETRLGDYQAYQVKFRSGRSALRWDELSTFMGLTDQVALRVLFTNCDDLPSLMNERKGFYCIRGSDLDRLAPADFQTILRWLKGSFVPVQKKAPVLHQQEALDTILPAFKEHDRVTALMACGTGKTLVALWVAEGMNCRKILVLVPSLALLRQTLHEWLKETHWQGLSYLCVCSDSSVAKDVDDVIVRQSDLDFPVTTDSATVRDFLARESEGVKVVFSTYQSSRVVAGGMTENEAFELGIFDEAHKTAGKVGVNFSFALTDDNLRINKRLFLTATPRHYDINHKDKEGEAKLVYSMDVPEIYGSVVYQLSFAEAARRQIICDYKVIISVVTSEMVNNELLRRGEVIVEGDIIKARHVANQIALKSAVEKHDIRKIFTFHRSVSSAKAFVSEGGEGIRSHLLEFEAFHVNGEMSTAKREKLMLAFRLATQAVMSNARCLTEGVDVPAVDMVAFLTPKRSRVDIVQATGRAMRKSPGKTTGYVLVPLFVEQAAGELIEDAVKRAEFDEVWAVLQAMQEQDELLVDIIRQMREDRGRTGGFDDSRFRERVEVLEPDLTLETLIQVINTLCLDKLGVTWDERFGELLSYKGLYGHCNVPTKWSENAQLATWVSEQRKGKKQGKLSKERIQRLNDIEFVWDTHDASWENKFEELKAFQVTHGHWRWPNNPQLGQWVLAQRQRHKQGTLSKERIRFLDEIGFVWDSLDAVWNERFTELKAFKATEGHCNVPQRWSKNPQLGKWVRTQRGCRQEGILSEERIQRLDQIGFVWDSLDALWEQRFSELEAFKATEGHCNVPRDWSDNPQLSTWVNNQRRYRKQNQLTEERIQRLNEIGFVWAYLATLWEERFTQLQAFKIIHGHCNVPYDWPDNPQLGIWVSEQRKNKKQGKLNEERIKCLDEVGFIWDHLVALWEQRFTELKEFKATHGHCNVPYDWPDNPELRTWVGEQRKKKKRNQLREERIYRLEQLGFVWDTLDAAWEEKFSELKVFKDIKGHCKVPKRWTENPQLGRWVINQRSARREGKLSEEHIQRLSEIGFVWEMKEI
jgi:superfamily II DNA or RNA helicase